MQERLVRLFRERFDSDPTAVLTVAGDGSTRSYRRLVGPRGETAIGAIGPDHDENRAFLAFSRALRGAGLPVPEVYGADEEAGAYLIEDLGDTSLFAALEEERTLAGGGFPESMIGIYRRVLEWLPRFQVEGHRHVDYDVAYPHHALDRRSILWDLNYFKYHFLKLAHVPFNEARLEADFEVLTAFLLEAEAEYFLYRDFQSRNVMLRGEEPWFIDYQGGRRGALQYDVASLLYDAKADLPGPVRDALLEHYLDALEAYLPIDRGRFRERYAGFILIRIFQAMGAYGYRGFFERKPRFLESVPYAARNLAGLLEAGLPVGMPEIERVLQRITEEWAPSPVEEGRPGLTVHLQSFSYRRGYPDEIGGHGGGFVFDCRALPNPGRETRFAEATGSDPEVREWLATRVQTEAFWGHVSALVEGAVTDYLDRGLSSLSVSFGCTGGQHRSVYFAERLKEHLERRFPDVHVILIHRERSRWPRPALLEWPWTR